MITGASVSIYFDLLRASSWRKNGKKYNRKLYNLLVLAGNKTAWRWKQLRVHDGSKRIDAVRSRCPGILGAPVIQRIFTKPLQHQQCNLGPLQSWQRSSRAPQRQGRGEILPQRQDIEIVFLRGWNVWPENPPLLHFTAATRGVSPQSRWEGVDYGNRVETCSFSECALPILSQPSKSMCQTKLAALVKLFWQ